MPVGTCRRDLRNETEKSWGVTSQPITPIIKRLSLASRGRIGSAVPSQSSSVPQFPVSPHWTWPWKPVCPYHRRRPVSYKKDKRPTGQLRQSNNICYMAFLIYCKDKALKAWLWAFLLSLQWWLAMPRCHWTCFQTALSQTLPLLPSLAYAIDTLLCLCMS